MKRLPRLKGKEIVRILERAGFQVVHTRGSHTFLKHPDGRATVIPLHSGEIIGPGLFRAILRDVEKILVSICEAVVERISCLGWSRLLDSGALESNATGR